MKNLLFASLALVASISFAADKAPAKKAAAAPAPVAVVKKEVTGVLKWTGFGVGKQHHGEIALKSGSVEMKASELTGGEFVLDMKSLKTGDSPKLEGHLRSPDFFDVEKFAEGTFKITKVEPLKTPGANYKLTGDLTIKGKTHSEEVMATVTKSGDAYTAMGESEIKDRTQYDIVYNSGKFKAISALGDKLIQDNIKINLELKTK